MKGSDRLLSLEEAADALGCSVRSLFTWRKQRRIRETHIFGTRKVGIPASEIDRIIERDTAPAHSAYGSYRIAAYPDGRARKARA